MVKEIKSNNGQSIICNSEQEGKTYLYNIYGNNYEIVSKSMYFQPHFFGLLGTSEKLRIDYIKREIKYPVQNFENQTKPQSNVSTKEIQNFEKNKNDILFRKKMESSFANQDEKFDAILNEIKEIKKNAGEKHETIVQIQELLQNNDFTLSYINEITRKIEETFSVSQLNDFEYVQRQVVDWIGESIKCEKEVVKRRPNVVILVGPTGVGKTTTLVKLAAANFLRYKTENYKPKVCFITVDTMRVAAFEQLERWGKLFDTQVLKATNVDEVSSCYLEVKDSVDFIFIDTSGYSPNDSSHIGMLKEMVNVPKLNPEIYLAVSATTKARDLENIMQNYEPFGYQSVIVTKCDESCQYGNVISALHKKQKTIAYVTDGQNVGNKTIKKVSVIDFLIRLDGFKIDRIHIEDKFGEN